MLAFHTPRQDQRPHTSYVQVQKDDVSPHPPLSRTTPAFISRRQSVGMPPETPGRDPANHADLDQGDAKSTVEQSGAEPVSASVTASSFGLQHTHASQGAASQEAHAPSLQHQQQLHVVTDHPDSESQAHSDEADIQSRKTARPKSVTIDATPRHMLPISVPPVPTAKPASSLLKAPGGKSTFPTRTAGTNGMPSEDASMRAKDELGPPSPLSSTVSAIFTSKPSSNATHRPAHKISSGSLHHNNAEETSARSEGAADTAAVHETHLKMPLHVTPAPQTMQMPESSRAPRSSSPLTGTHAFLDTPLAGGDNNRPSSPGHSDSDPWFLLSTPFSAVRATRMVVDRSQFVRPESPPGSPLPGSPLPRGRLPLSASSSGAPKRATSPLRASIALRMGGAPPSLGAKLSSDISPSPAVTSAFGIGNKNLASAVLRTSNNMPLSRPNSATVNASAPQGTSAAKTTSTTAAVAPTSTPQGTSSFNTPATGRSAAAVAPTSGQNTSTHTATHSSSAAGVVAALDVSASARDGAHTSETNASSLTVAVAPVQRAG
jgi:hypothetical protein